MDRKTEWNTVLGSGLWPLQSPEPNTVKQRAEQHPSRRLGNIPESSRLHTSANLHAYLCVDLCGEGRALLPQMEPLSLPHLPR